MSSYYLSRDGRQLGPFSDHELRTMLATGQATTADLACAVGDAQWKPVHTFPGFGPVPGGGGSVGGADSAVSSIVPYKNPPALIGYYLGVFSLIPCIGFLLGIAAIILGTIGLRKSANAPGSKGKAHAWTAIVLGSVGILVTAALVLVAIMASPGPR